MLRKVLRLNRILQIYILHHHTIHSIKQEHNYRGLSVPDSPPCEFRTDKSTAPQSFHKRRRKWSQRPQLEYTKKPHPRTYKTTHKLSQTLSILRCSIDEGRPASKHDTNSSWNSLGIVNSHNYDIVSARSSDNHSRIALYA